MFLYILNLKMVSYWYTTWNLLTFDDTIIVVLFWSSLLYFTVKNILTKHKLKCKLFILLAGQKSKSICDGKQDRNLRKESVDRNLSRNMEQRAAYCLTPHWSLLTQLGFLFLCLLGSDTWNKFEYSYEALAPSPVSLRSFYLCSSFLMRSCTEFLFHFLQCIQIMVFPLLLLPRSLELSNSLIPYSLYLSVNRNQTGKQTDK